MAAYLALAPEIILALAALVALFADVLGGDRTAAAIGAVAAGAVAWLVWVFPPSGDLFGGMLSFSAGTGNQALRSAIPALTCLFLVWVLARGWAGLRAREAVSMVLFSTLGGMLLVSANDLVLLFLALEVATMPAYILIGYAQLDRRGLEGALKYFLLSLLTSLFLSYGLSFLFGISGSTSYASIDLSHAGALGLAAAIMVLVGLFAKITAAPFHFWSPDAYEGATVPAVAFVASVAKIGPLVAAVHLVSQVLVSAGSLSTVLFVVSIISMVLGNLAALVQTDLRRLIAYSGIANAGYLLLGLGAANLAGYASSMFFVVVYTVGVMGLLLVVAAEGSTMSDIAGLVRRRPLEAWCSIGFLFSLIGFPPMAGFYGKLTVFGSALGAGYTIPVVVAVIMSIISAGYAFNVIRAMFTPGENAPEEVVREPIELTSSYPQWRLLAGTVVLALALLTIALGVIAQPLVNLLQAGLF